MYYKTSEPRVAVATVYTVSDPIKVELGPSMNILIKLMSIVFLVIAPYLRDWWVPNLHAEPKGL